MKSKSLFTVIVVTMSWNVAATSYAKQLIARSGFNDQTGIYSDATLNSPFQFGSPVMNRGAAEPGWNFPWYGGDCCNAGLQRVVVEANAGFEGDGALRINGQPSSGEAWAYRRWGFDIGGPFLIEQHIRITDNANFGSRPGSGGSGALIGPQWNITGNQFQVFDGDTQQGGGFENTGIAITPNQWYKVATLVDPVSKTWQFFVNDVRYETSDPLGFRGNPAFIDRVDYLSASTVWVDDVRIYSVPEPATGWAALTVFAGGAIARLGRWTKRRSCFLGSPS